MFESIALPPGLEVLLEQKAADLFAICDQEDKGFVTKRDMQRLRDELPLDPDQLENVFDALDQDQNGFLTLEEFAKGFESYLGLEIPDHLDNINREVITTTITTKVTTRSQKQSPKFHQKTLCPNNLITNLQ